ncbi:hypothetical protein PT974_07526 [Cladobotryum mycophilum]|uniref:Uncharacterized protein n=1 Tax=Cladobotryum mycophilum TaxID=491253 RepID=A0ABR0SQU3_9HYPO
MKFSLLAFIALIPAVLANPHTKDKDKNKNKPEDNTEPHTYEDVVKSTKNLRLPYFVRMPKDICSPRNPFKNCMLYPKAGSKAWHRMPKYVLDFTNPNDWIEKQDDDDDDGKSSFNQTEDVGGGRFDLFDDDDDEEERDVPLEKSLDLAKRDASTNWMEEVLQNGGYLSQGGCFLKTTDDGVCLTYECMKIIKDIGKLIKKAKERAEKR